MSSKAQPRAPGAAGFTLVEILVALAIVGLTLAALFEVFSNGLRGTDSAERHTVATLLARSKLAEVGVIAPLEAGEEAGEYDGGFSWRSVISPHETTNGGLPEEPGARTFVVTVEVAWGAGNAEKRVSLTTLRLAPVVR